MEGNKVILISVAIFVTVPCAFFVGVEFDCYDGVLGRKITKTAASLNVAAVLSVALCYLLSVSSYHFEYMR